MTTDYTNFFDFQMAGEEEKKALEVDFESGLHASLKRLKVKKAARARIVRGLWESMSAVGRHYHSPVHVLGMFGYAAKHGMGLSDAESLAVWYHDCVYDPDAANGANEEQSAARMVEELKGEGVREGVLSAAAGMIRSTSRHGEDDLPTDHARVLDLDLAGFTAPAEVFRRLSEALRREYLRISDASYAEATCRFLHTLLARKRIFRTTEFARYEPEARRRIAEEADRLVRESLSDEPGRR